MQVVEVDFAFIAFYIEFGLVVLQFVCALIPDHKAIRVPRKRSAETGPLSEETRPLLFKDENIHLKSQQLIEGKQCPKIGATFLSVAFFHWFTP